MRYRDGRTIEERIDRARLFEVARELFGVELPIAYAAAAASAARGLPTATIPSRYRRPT